MIWLHVLAPVSGRVHDFKIFDFPYQWSIVSFDSSIKDGGLLNVFVTVLQNGDDSSVIRVGDKVHGASNA